MKRFHFPLRPVVIVRSHLEARAREALAEAIRDGNQSEERLNAAGARVIELAGVIATRRRERLSARDETAYSQSFRRECAGEAEAQKQVTAARALIVQRRDAYLESRRQMKIVNRLEERALAAHRLAGLRAEQAEIDEIANRRRPLAGNFP